MHAIYQNGIQLTEEDFYQQLHDTDIILVGEYHNNAAGHAVEALIAKELLSKTPTMAVAMEMFERHYQPLVDLFLKGDISSTALEKSTFASNWGGVENTWQDWYQPIVNCVKDFYPQGARLIAANASRSYVKIANHEGYAPLQQLKDQGNEMFEIPDPKVDVSEYIDNLNKLRSAGPMHAHAKNDSDDKKPSRPAMPMGRPGGFLDAQQLWDATMSHSVALAYQDHPKVLLFIGDFHVKRNGGTTQRVKHFLPDAKVANISILPMQDTTRYNSEHDGHADFVIYTQAPEA